MTTTEIIANFMKHNSKATISEKQKSWLIRQAKNEGFVLGFDGYSDSIYFNDCFYKIKQCKTLASGGSYVGTRVIQGKYNMEKLYTVKFTDTGYVFVYNQQEVERVTKEGYQFEIIKPVVNTSKR
jgi:hypothetical protein